MKHPFSENPQVGLSSSFSELVNTPFHGTTNALCWYRNLEGDFKEIISKLTLNEDITEISMEELQALELSEKGRLARTTILNDFQQLYDFGAQPTLNLLKCYERDHELDFISTDVYSYHVDRSPILMDTYLCTYHGAASDIIPNEQVVQKILIPEIREQLRSFHDATESDFETFLTENFFDLHYQALPNSKPTNLGNGHLWRLAVDNPQQHVPPCVHRAPIENEGLRLMMIC